MTSQIHTAAFNTIAAVDQWMKVIGNNVTGSTVTGYKGSKVEFGEVLNAQIRGGAKATDGYGSVNPIQRSDSGIKVIGTSTDFSQGSLTATSNPTNMAIDGDAFFVLSRVPVPRSIEDLVFTRNGDFHMEFIKGDVKDTGTNRLVNSEGLFVQGYNYPVSADRPFELPPAEAQGDGQSAFNTQVPALNGQPPLSVGIQNLQLDHVRNPDAANNVSFKTTGLMLVKGAEPRDLANNDANMYVALAKFSNSQGLIREGGGAYFKYDVVAGRIMTGTAGNEQNGPIGNSNVIRSSALETANTSINTTLPEITLAQKSFSATSKLISVGNTMIDDVNGLVR